MSSHHPRRLYSSEASVLITGASAGLGAAIAMHLAPYGGKIALFARRGELLEEVAAQVASAGATPLVLVGDVTKPDQVRSAYRQMAQQQGPVDFAFLNAGVGDSQTLDQLTAERVRQVFDVNVFGVVNWLEHLVPPMIERGAGAIVGLSSLAANRGGPAAGPYCASKAALSVLLESIRLEARQYGLQVFTVEPGFIRSNLTAKNNFPMPLLMDAAVAARQLCDAIVEGKPLIRFPWPLAAAVRMLRLLPIGLYDRLAGTMLQRSTAGGLKRT